MKYNRAQTFDDLIGMPLDTETINAGVDAALERLEKAVFTFRTIGMKLDKNTIIEISGKRIFPNQE